MDTGKPNEKGSRKRYHIYGGVTEIHLSFYMDYWLSALNNIYIACSDSVTRTCDSPALRQKAIEPHDEKPKTTGGCSSF